MRCELCGQAVCPDANGSYVGLDAEIARLAEAYVDSHEHSSVGHGPLLYPALRDAVRRRRLVLGGA